jgi:hypothetical protein
MEAGIGNGLMCNANDPIIVHQHDNIKQHSFVPGANQIPIRESFNSLGQAPNFQLPLNKPALQKTD